MVVFGVSTNHGRYFVVKSALLLKAAVGLSARIELLISRNRPEAAVWRIILKIALLGQSGLLESAVRRQFCSSVRRFDGYWLRFTPVCAAFDLAKKRNSASINYLVIRHG
jgi:hypothetical protein